MDLNMIYFSLLDSVEAHSPLLCHHHRHISMHSDQETTGPTPILSI